MAGELVVDHAALRRIARRLDDLDEQVRRAARALDDTPDAGESTGELAGSLGELRSRVDQVVSTLKPLGPVLQRVAQEFERSDDDVAADFRIHREMPHYYGDHR